MALGNVKKEGKSVLMTALAVGLGVAIISPLVAIGYAWVMGKFKPAAPAA